MFKSMLILAIFALLSIASASVFAVGNVSDNGTVSVLSVESSTNNDAVLLQAVIKSSDIAKNATPQPKFKSAEKSESVFSTEWLFLVALFWFVILSNRRGV